MHDRPSNPDAVSHRYTAMCAKLGISSHLHGLRHYTATELITAGVDLRAVAGRLGHGGGVTTTLRVYTASVSKTDRRAAQILDSRLSRPPLGPRNGVSSWSGRDKPIDAVHPRRFLSIEDDQALGHGVHHLLATVDRALGRQLNTGPPNRGP